MSEHDPEKPGEPRDGAPSEPEPEEPEHAESPGEDSTQAEPPREEPIPAEPVAEETARAEPVPEKLARKEAELEPAAVAEPARAEADLPARTCPNCKTVTKTKGVLCPSCGAMYDPGTAPKGGGFDGCLAVFGGVLVGAVGFIAIFALLTSIGGASDLASGIMLVVADVAAIVLSIFLVARRGRIRYAPFLIGMTITFAGFMTACSLMLLSFSKAKF